jgi:hypothetical protein
MARAVGVIFLCLAVFSLLGNAGFVLYFLHREAEERRAGGDPDKPGAAPVPTGSPGFPFDKDPKINLEYAQSFGVEVGRAQPAEWRDRVTVYGRVVPNPRATYEVRSPFAGTLLAGDKPWPNVGEAVTPGQLLGSVAVRVTPQERLELQNKLAEAMKKEEGARVIHDLRTAAVARLEKAPSAVIAQRDLDEAKVQLAEARTQLATAEAAVQIWRKTLDDIDQMQDKPSEAWRRPLAVPAEPGLGALEVTELAAQPGTAVEAGGLVARLVDPSRALVRLDLPAKLAAKGPPEKLKLTAAPDAEPVPAALAGPAPAVDGASQLAGFYYLVRDRSWRPGRFVTAELPAPQPPRAAVSVPAAAVLSHQGRALVYVVQDEKFQRREVQVLGSQGGRCFVAPRNPIRSLPNCDLEPDEVVVVGNPQVLLSLEFRRNVDND